MLLLGRSPARNKPDGGAGPVVPSLGDERSLRKQQSPRKSSGPPGAASPRTLKATGLDAIVAVAASQRGAIVKEEADVRQDALTRFASTATDLAAYEAKVARMDARMAQHRAVETERTLRQNAREMEALCGTLEPQHRATLRILEDKCVGALTHVLCMERAVIACREALVRLQAMEASRRTFVAAFQEREVRQLQEAADTLLLRPRMQCLGGCPFVRPADCPFRSGKRGGVRVDEASHCHRAQS